MSNDQTLSPEQRRRRARIAAHASCANTADRTHHTSPAARGFLARFERQVDPNGVLDPETRAQRAQHARKAYMLQLAERSSKVRRRESK